jgi:dTDP-L-rhamnose 4-epimerase
MRTLVTGGAGFIGSHLVRRLVELGDDVVVLDSLESQVHGGKPPELPDGVEFHHGDVGEIELVDTALDGVDRIVHLAAAVGVGQSMYEIADYVRKNTHATAVFLERLVARPTRPSRLVVASSMSIYGEGEYVCALHGHVAPVPRGEEQLARRSWECFCSECGRELEPVATREQKPLIPTSVYAVTKRDHEELALVVGAAYDIPTTALRFFNVYGPGQSLSNPYTGVAAIFSSRLLNGRPPLVFEDGHQTRDFVHVSDIVEGLLLALGSNAAVGRAINLGTGRRTSVLDVAAALADGLGVEIEPEVNGRYRAGDIRHCYADTRLAEELLGFRARVSLERGMDELISWLADQSAEDRVAAATGELAAWGLTR